MRGHRAPFENVEQLFEQMRREMFGSMGTPAIESQQSDGRWDVGITVEETDDGFVVVADLPGFARDELSIRLHDDVLHLDGEHAVGDETSYRSRRVSERVPLPASVDPEHVTARYHNGVLEVRFVVEDDDAAGGTRIDIE